MSSKINAQSGTPPFSASTDAGARKVQKAEIKTPDDPTQKEDFAGLHPGDVPGCGAAPVFRLNDVSAVLGFLICLLLINVPTLGKSLGRPTGIFEICKHPVSVTKVNLLKAHLNKKKILKITRICAIIDDKTFSEAELTRFGWKLVTRIGDVATLQGDAESLRYLEALDGLRLAQSPWIVPRKNTSMDSARKLTRVNFVNGTTPSSLSQAYTGKNVLVGIIDNEFDVHHPAFLDAQGKTRFIALWDQADSVINTRNSPPYGRIKSGQALQADTLIGLSEDAHGTLMASYAAGSDKTYPYWGMAPEAMIIGVKYTNNNTSANVIDGLDWIFRIADSLKVPCVANLSIGEAAGPHDGTSAVDKAIDAVSATPGHIVVGAMGNDGADKRHISFTLANNQAKSTWLDPSIDSLTKPARVIATSDVDLWGELNIPFSVTVNILDKKTLKYEQSTAISTQNNGSYLDTIIGTISDSVIKKSDTLLFYFYIARKSSLNQKPNIYIAYQSSNPDLAMGISVALLNNASGTVNAWTPNKKDFVNNSITDFLEGDNVSSLNEIGSTAKKIIAVGAYCSKPSITTWNHILYDRGQSKDSIYGKISWFSSRGPSIDGRIKPDICAPGDMVVGAMPSPAKDIGQTVIWPDTNSTKGRYTRGTGTSVSSPIVAGAIALMLQIKPTLTVDQVRQILDSTAIHDEYTGPLASKNNIWGPGKLDAYAAVASVAGVIPVEIIKSNSLRSIGLVNVSASKNKILNISFNFEKQIKVQLDIYSMDGRRAFSATLIKNSTHLALKLANGVYFAKLQRDGKTLANQKIALFW